MTFKQLDLQKITKPWSPPSHRKYVFTSANLLDPIAGAVIKNTTIRLVGGLVSSVEPTGKNDISKDDPETFYVDMKDKYICPVPGSLSLREMKDMSNNQSVLRQPNVCESMLSRGFTTVRDCGGASFALKESLEEGVIRGPRLFIAGHALSQTGGHGDRRQRHDPNECCAGHVNGVGRIVDGVDQCLKYAREELRQGSDFIKIMGGGGVASPTDHIQHLQFSDEEIRAIVTVAKNAGTYVTSHAYTPQAIQQAIRQGVKGIEHGNLIDESTARMMKDNGVFLTPTLVTYATMAAPEFRDFLPPASVKKNQEVLQSGLHALRLANEIGVDICFGTDLLGPLHYAQSKEFSIRSTVQSALEVFRSATTIPARMLGQEKLLGQIAPGYAADILILNTNPLEDITVFDRPDQHLLAVLKEGRVLCSRWTQLHAETNIFFEIE
ncbi:unnamed protein product [Penicillium pancosmium]